MKQQIIEKEVFIVNTQIKEINDWINYLTSSLTNKYRKKYLVDSKRISFKFKISKGNPPTPQNGSPIFLFLNCVSESKPDILIIV